MRNTILAILLLLTISWLAAETIPSFKLPDLNNKEVKLEDLLNRGPVLIDFWATWCTSCKKGMIALNQLAEKYDSLTIVMISIDAPKDVTKAKSYLKTNDYKFVALFDSEKKYAAKLNVTNPPRTIILDKTGEVVLSHDGYEAGTESIYEGKIRELLKLPALESAMPDCGSPVPCSECPVKQ